MDVRFLKKIINFGILFIVGVFLVMVQTNFSYAQKSQKINGLNFEVPEDWPIEKRNGIIAPIPTEEYVAIKFKMIEEEFETIKEDFTVKFKELQFNLENMETKFLEEIKKVQAQDAPRGSVNEDLSEILSKLGLLESELSRLDRKITNKTAKTKTKSEEIVRQISVIEEKMNEFQSQVYKLSEEVDYIFDKQENSY